MKKRLPFLFLTVVLFMVCLCLSVSADSGPKPSVTVAFPTLEGTYCATLLSKSAGTGPYSTDMDLFDDAEARITEKRQLDAFRAFRTYSDPDGYYFIGFVATVSASADLVWGYYPPQDFKVLLYDCDTGEMAAGEPQSRYAFASRFEAKLTESAGQKQIAIRRSYDYFGQLLQFLLRLAVTLGVEMLLALAFGMLRTGRLRVVLVVNLLTQILLNGMLQFSVYKHGASPYFLPAFYFLAEAAVFVIEAAVYVFFFARGSVPEDRRLSKAKCVLYALAANAASFAAGVALWFLLP